MTHDSLRQVVRSAEFDLDDERLGLLEHYLELLERDRERLDLTAIRDHDELERRQVGESLALLGVVEGLGLPKGARLTDVGSGGGVPGIPIAIARPDLDLVLIESSTRKGLRSSVSRDSSESASRWPEK